jgi:hypothetical protein
VKFFIQAFFFKQRQELSHLLRKKETRYNLADTNTNLDRPRENKGTKQEANSKHGEKQNSYRQKLQVGRFCIEIP